MYLIELFYLRIRSQTVDDYPATTTKIVTVYNNPNMCWLTFLFVLGKMNRMYLLPDLLVGTVDGH